MSYYCTKCNKDHKIGYKTHLRFAEYKELNSPNPDFYVELMEKVERLENRLETIIVILKAWKVYIDRKHPYARNYHQFFLILDEL